MICTVCENLEKEHGKARGVKRVKCRSCTKDTMVLVDHKNICNSCSRSFQICTRCGITYTGFVSEGNYELEKRVKHTLDIKQGKGIPVILGNIEVTCTNLTKIEGNVIEADGVIIKLPFEVGEKISKESVKLSKDSLEKLMREVVFEDKPFSHVIEIFANHLESNQIMDLYYKIKGGY